MITIEMLTIQLHNLPTHSESIPLLPLSRRLMGYLHLPSFSLDSSVSVRNAQGSVSGQLALVLIWNAQVLYQALGLYCTRVRIRPLDNTVLL